MRVSQGINESALKTAGVALTEPILFFGIPFDFILFALTLFGIALFHRHTLVIALAGLAAITAYKLSFTGFNERTGLVGLGFHLSHEFSLLSNLFLLLMGFALLSRHFEESAIPDEMPALLPDGWKGGLVLLAIVFVLSSFLDNIAGAIIGGTVARHVFRGKVHMGYLAAIVAASNAGGSGSVVGDTTTTWRLDDLVWFVGRCSPIEGKVSRPMVAQRLAYSDCLCGWIFGHASSYRLASRPRSSEIEKCRCPLLAQSGHKLVHCTCPLSGVKRTFMRGIQCRLLLCKHTGPVQLLNINFAETWS